MKFSFFMLYKGEVDCPLLLSKHSALKPFWRHELVPSFGTWDLAQTRSNFCTQVGLLKEAMSESIGEAERRERPEGEGLAEGENPTDEITVLRNRKRLLKLQLKAAASALKKQDWVSILFVSIFFFSHLAACPRDMSWPLWLVFQERLRRKALAKTKALTDEDLVWILRKRQAH